MKALVVLMVAMMVLGSFSSVGLAEEDRGGVRPMISDSGQFGIGTGGKKISWWKWILGLAVVGVIWRVGDHNDWDFSSSSSQKSKSVILNFGDLSMDDENQFHFDIDMSEGE